jgi:dolichol-phosphate mannosyltransferase
MNKPINQCSLSVVIPVFNDEEVLPELYRRLRSSLDILTNDYEVIFVDDGSSDRSMHVLNSLLPDNGLVTVVQLTRNFGQQNAIFAGIECAKGDVVIIMDSDLQDRPEDISKLLTAMEDHNTSMAVAGCASRGDNAIKIAASNLFNSISNKLTSVHFPPRARVFRAIRRDILDELKKISDNTSTPLSLLGWMGYDYIVVDLDRDPRFAGRSGYTVQRMIKLSLDRIFSFSLFPIRLSSVLGIILGIISVFLAMFFIIQKLFLRDILPGWTSIVVIVLFLLGMNFIFIGILGEYMGRIYMEVKDRPRYVIRDIKKGENQK